MTTDLTQLVNTTMTKVCKVKADEDGLVTKTINVEMTFKDIPLRDIVYTSMSPKVIQLQGKIRKKFNNYTDNQTIKVSFVSPSKVQVDPEEAIKAKLKTFTPEEREAYIKKLTEDLDEYPTE